MKKSLRNCTYSIDFNFDVKYEYLSCIHIVHDKAYSDYSFLFKYAFHIGKKIWCYTNNQINANPTSKKRNLNRPPTHNI